MLFPFIKPITALAVKFGYKPLKYFIDSTFRQKVTPVPGSVLYCDLFFAVEHSGIHVAGGDIANIEVDGFADSAVNLTDAEGFTSKSLMGRKIYVSSNSNGAVGRKNISTFASRHVGQRDFYGLVVKNCHQFSTKCVNTSAEDVKSSVLDNLLAMLPNETWEPTMQALKRAAKQKLGATKWLLWDWQNSEEREEEPEPDWEAQNDHFKNQPLNEESIANIREQLAQAQEYEQEIADEKIPEDIRNKLAGFRQTLQAISAKYEEVKGFLARCPGANFSYADLEASPEDFSALAAIMQKNLAIKDLARKMGRSYISEEKKKQTRIPEASRSEVHGTHRSNDLMRMLPSELVNLEDETLETLFYARLLEHNLLTYELSGTQIIDGETTEDQKKRTGPVVACLDTSGSMSGDPMLKAKALLLSLANILKQEDRTLHVLLFGSSGQINEFVMDAENNSSGLLKFLQKGFGGGTDFETPLKRATEIISKKATFIKADILMISDGDCSLSTDFSAWLKSETKRLDCSVYSVLCAGLRVQDEFSDEVITL